MLGSHNHFFSQSKTVLALRRRDVAELLRIKGYRSSQVEVYLKAFDYFVANTTSYDGATIVKDLCDVPGLDLDAMLHDYHFIVCGVGSNFLTKWKADWLFSKGQERKGKGIRAPYERFVGLTIASVFFVPYAFIKRGRIATAQRKEFNEDYQILIPKKP